MKTIPEHPVNFNGFHDRYIKPLGRHAVTTHYQIFPGSYAADQQTFDATKDLSRPLSSIGMSADYLGQVRRAKTLGAPFRRLRVLPYAGQQVGQRTYDTEDRRVMADISRRNLHAGEEVRITSYDQVERIMPRSGLGRYMDEYTRGVQDGVSRLSFWTVAEAKEGAEVPELLAVRLMSYDAAGGLAVRTCSPPLDAELADYLTFWQSVFTRARPLETVGEDL